MAEPPKFTPKKRPKSCMQGSDDSSDSTVEDLCRKKFKPIAPKPFLQKDSHQSMLTTVLPVKQPPQSDTKDTFTPADTGNASVSSCSKTGKCGDDLPTMPVMYGGPVFIPVRFPFPVLVPAMFNVNGNQQQKCTCCPSKEMLNKPGHSEDIGTKSEGETQQSCPVHYSLKSNQPTYINTPLPNVQSSFMPMYMSSGNGVAAKGDWSGKPKYNRYKYSMLKNGDIYKGMASSFQNYGDWNQPLNCSQFPGDHLTYTVKNKQYSGRKLDTETSNQPQGDPSRRASSDTPCSDACTVPSKCDTMCQTSVQTTVGQSVVLADSHPPKDSTPNRALGVDAAVQTDNQEIETNVRQHTFSDTVSKQRNSSSAQCSLSSTQTSLLVSEPESHAITTVSCIGASPSNASLSSAVGGKTKSSDMQSTSTLSSSSAFRTSSNSATTLTSHGSTASSEQDNTLPAPAAVVPSRGRGQDANLSVLTNLSERPPPPDTNRERDENFNEHLSRRVQRMIFSSESETSTSSEALQQRNYKTDVIVPLRAAPSPSDAHDSEDMDRFVLSPVISETDSEDIFNRQLRPSAGYFRQPQNRLGEGMHSATPSLARTSGIPSLNSIQGSHPSSHHKALDSLPPAIVHAPGRTSNQWTVPSSQSTQGHENQLSHGSYPAAAMSKSVGFSAMGAHTAQVSTVSEHINPYTPMTTVSSYHPPLPLANSPYVGSNSFLKEPQNSLLHPLVRARSHHAYSPTSLALSTQTFSSPVTSRETAGFPGTSGVHLTEGVSRMPTVNTNHPHASRRKENSQVSDQAKSQTIGDGSKENSDNPNDKRMGEATQEGGRFAAHIQSVPLQSNIAGHGRGGASGHRLQRKDGANASFTNMEGSSEYPFLSIGHNVELANSSTSRHSVPLHRQHRREVTEKPSEATHLPNPVVSSSTGYSVSCVPSIGCLNSPIQIHESSAHPVHGYSQRPISGSSIHGPMPSGISPHNRSTHPHPFQPAGTYHSQHSHMYYPHYGGLHQPLGMSSNPAPSHTDLSLLSPRSCAHLHIHGNMLHSPQMPSSMHNFQRPSSFSSGLHTGSYSYTAHDDRLDTCCTSRLGHSPTREDRSIPTLLTNILHRRPGAFSHLERTAYVDHPISSSPCARPTQAAVVGSSVGSTCTVAPSVQNRPSTSSTSSTVGFTESATLKTADTGTLQSQSGPTPSVSRSGVVTSVASSSKASNTLNNAHSAQSSTEPTKVCSLPPASVSSSAQPLTATSSSHQASSASVVAHSDNPSASATPSGVTLSTTSPCAPSHSVSRSLPGNNSDKYLPVEAIPPSPASGGVSVPTPDSGRQNADQVIKYGETVLKCSRQILRESGRTVLCCWSCDYHTAEPRKMHRHQKKEMQLQKCQLCDFKSDTRCKVNQHYKEVHMDKDDPFRSVTV